MNAKEKLFAFCEERGLEPCWFGSPTKSVAYITDFWLCGVRWRTFMRWAGSDDVASPDAKPLGKDNMPLGKIAATTWYANIGVGGTIEKGSPKHLFVSLRKTVGVVPAFMRASTDLGRLAMQKCVEATGWNEELVTKVLESIVPELTDLYNEALKEARGE